MPTWLFFLILISSIVALCIRLIPASKSTRTDSLEYYLEQRKKLHVQSCKLDPDAEYRAYADRRRRAEFARRYEQENGLRSSGASNDTPETPYIHLDPSYSHHPGNIHNIS